MEKKSWNVPFYGKNKQIKLEIYYVPMKFAGKLIHGGGGKLA